MRGVSLSRIRFVSSESVDRVLTTNLSYVLHEPSTSTVVQQYARRIETSRSRIGASSNRLGRLSDDQLRHHFVIEAQEIEALKRAVHSGDALGVVTLRLGAWGLLSRALSVAAESAPGVITKIHTFDRASGRTGGLPRTTWFRADSLIAPPPPEISLQRCIFATALMRPDCHSLLLSIREVGPCWIGPVERENNADAWSEEVVEYAQAAVREHVEQWWCEEQLWSHPVEATLPEFLAD